MCRETKQLFRASGATSELLKQGNDEIVFLVKMRINQTAFLKGKKDICFGFKYILKNLRGGSLQSPTHACI